MDLGSAAVPAATSTASQVRRSERAQIDIARIRGKAADDPLVTQLLGAACSAMAKATANHASEWLPAGHVATDGSITAEGKLCTAALERKPWKRAKYDALPSTSTGVERLHAMGRCSDDRGKVQRLDSRAGVTLGAYNGQSNWLGNMDPDEQAARLGVARSTAAVARKVTMKAQLLAVGRAKREARDALLSPKRSRRKQAAAEKARVGTVVRATRYSELTAMAIPALQDQLKAFKLGGATGFTTTQQDRTAYITQLQRLVFDCVGAEANDLADGDSGCGRDRVLSVIRRWPPRAPSRRSRSPARSAPPTASRSSRSIASSASG
jgi:hypothetical protein